MWTVSSLFWVKCHDVCDVPSNGSGRKIVSEKRGDRNTGGNVSTARGLRVRVFTVPSLWLLGRSELCSERKGTQREAGRKAKLDEPDHSEPLPVSESGALHR